MVVATDPLRQAHGDITYALIPKGPRATNRQALNPYNNTIFVQPRLLRTAVAPAKLRVQQTMKVAHETHLFWSVEAVELCSSLGSSGFNRGPDGSVTMRAARLGVQEVQPPVLVVLNWYSSMT